MPSQVAPSKAQGTMEMTKPRPVEAQQGPPTIPTWAVKFANLDLETFQRAKDYSLRIEATFGRMLDNQKLVSKALSVVEARFIDEAWGKPICMEPGCVGYEGRLGAEVCWDCRRKQVARWHRRENSEKRLRRVGDNLDRQAMAELGRIVQEAREDHSPVFRDLIENKHLRAWMMDWQYAVDHLMSSKA